MSKKRIVGVLAATFLAVVGGWHLSARPASKTALVAHEWGTFTALQDDDGTALGAINTDDEPVPDFVHQIGGFRTLSSQSMLSPFLANPYSKGLMQCHPDVTMRLETPVIYFYPSEKGGGAPVDVHVQFRGGWLTEFYPRAVAEAPDLTKAPVGYPALTPATSGSLVWNRVELGASGELTPTDDPVWTTPREVARAATVNVPPPDKEAGSADHPEKFLFYRGVGHLVSPLRVVRNPRADRLSLHADLSAMRQPTNGPSAPDLRIPAAWLIEIRPQDGFCAFRAVPTALDLGAAAGQELVSLPASFLPAEFNAHRLQELRGAMHEALVAAGLFPDEAVAMLKTWELSYFKSPGRRLFYVAPRAWTDQVLPLTIDGAAITRAMIGRIELITPAQRERLARIAAGPCPDLAALSQRYRGSLESAEAAWVQRVGLAVAERTRWTRPTLAEANVPIPPLYQDYLDLGRFRDALVLDEQRQRPTAALAAFIAGNQLRARWPSGEQSTFLEQSTFSSFP